MEIYSKVFDLFRGLIDYNNSNIETVATVIKDIGTTEIQITNVYYISILDNKNKDITNFINYLNNAEHPNPFEDIKTNISIDKEQFYNIELPKITLKELGKSIDEILNTVDKSISEKDNTSAKLVFILDINVLFNLILFFDEDDKEIHIYDFILNKLKNKVNKVLILDEFNSLKIDGLKSNVVNELEIYLLKNKPEFPKIIHSNEITIYKYFDCIYWKVLNLNQRIEYISADEKDTEQTFVEIDGIDALIKTVKIEKICFSNIFENHKFVLHPLDKLDLISIYE